MELRSQRAIAARIMKCGKSRVWFDPARLGDISQAITSEDVRRLIRDGIIAKRPEIGNSSARIEKRRGQKKKGRRKGIGSRHGTLGSRFSRKKDWINKIRSQRRLLKELKTGGKINDFEYKILYKRAGGGFFRSRSHLLTFVEKEMRKGKF